MNIDELIKQLAYSAFPEMMGEEVGFERDAIVAYEVDLNANIRGGYIKTLKNFFDPSHLWRVFEVGKAVAEEFDGKETTVAEFGEKMLKKYIELYNLTK